jgi:DNA adenine methylase
MKGLFNVPYGGKKAGNIPSNDALSSCAKALKKVRLVSGDFAKTIECVKSGDFVYMDPPFFVEDRRVFKEYSGSIFQKSDLTRLKKWMDKLNKRKIDFVVSYAKCKEAEILGEGYIKKTVKVRRSIAGFSDKRRHSKEYIITNIRRSLRQ